ALIHDPEVIILDEPTIGIDPQQVIDVREIVRSLREKHTVLFSSHILLEVEQVCDRVVILQKGRIVASGAPEILSKRLKPGTHLYIHIEGASTPEVRKILEKIPGVETVRKEKDGFILSGKDEEIRSRVAAVIAENHLTLL